MRVGRYVILFIALAAGVIASQEPVALRLGEIDQYIARRQNETAVWYESRVEVLTLRAEERFGEYERAELERLAHQELVRRTYLRDNHFDIPPGAVLSQEQMDAAEERIAMKYEQIAAELQRAIEQLDERTEYVLDTQLPELEERLRRAAVTPQPAPPAGMVIGIAYSPQKGLALVGDKIVQPGDDVEGVEILAIGPHSVVFKRGRNEWEQSVRENPAEFWGKGGRWLP